jgi:hypothetical protein
MAMPHILVLTLRLSRPNRAVANRSFAFEILLTAV